MQRFRNQFGGSIADMIEYLESCLVEGHDASTHRYQDNPDLPGTCKVCDWIHPETAAPCQCGHTLREHAEEMLRLLKEAVSGKKCSDCGQPLLEHVEELLQFLRNALEGRIPVAVEVEFVLVPDTHQPWNAYVN